MRAVLPATILIVGLAGAVALVLSKPDREPLGARERVWLVTAEIAHPGPRSPHLTLYGHVDSPRIANLSAAVSADVTLVMVQEGEEVEAESPLVILDDREAGLLLAERSADIAAQLDLEDQRHENDIETLAHERQLLELARKEVTRAENLVRRNVGSRSNLDQARQAEERQTMAVDQRRHAIRAHESRRARLEARRDRARALRDRTRLDLERTRILAPFAGRVSNVQVSPGDRVRAGDKLISMFDVGAMEIWAQIPIRHLPAVRASLENGREITASSIVDGVEIGAVLERLSGEVSRGSGGADGLFRVTQRGAWLPLGRTVEIVLTLPPLDDVISLPFEAIYGVADRIYLLADGKMKGIRIERLGEIRTPDGGARALVRGAHLQEGAQVITTQLPNAIDGLPVKQPDTP